jgi:hypothetical protein
MPASTTTMRRFAAVLAATALTVTGCGNTDSWVDAHAAQGWSAQYADAANSSYSPVDGATSLKLQWSRSVKGELGEYETLLSNRKARDLLGFRPEHSWRKYVK